MVHRCGRRRALTPILVFVCLVAAAAFGAPAGAAGTEAFTVTDVEVDVTADTAAAAREQALVQGQRQATRRLLERLTLRQDHDQLPMLPNAGILELVQGIEVQEEKTSSVRYIGNLTVSFKPGAIRRLLRARDIRYAETMSKPVLVLPVYRAQGTAILWDEPNPWRQAWADRPRDDSLVPLVVPEGDLADIAAISAEQALAAAPERLEAIARRYGASDTLLAVASLSTDARRTGPVIDVAVSRYGPLAEESTMILSFSAEGGETVDQLLRRAAAEVAIQVEEEWKRNNLLQFGHEETITVTVPLEALSDWLAVRRRLEDLAFIRDARLAALTRQAATVDLNFLGDVAQLKLALAQSDLILEQGAVSWELRLRGSGAPRSPRGAEAAGVETRQ